MMLSRLLLAAMLAGCNTLDCVTANGEPEERTIELPAIQGVNAEGSIDVTITRGEPQRIVVRGPREIIDLIKFWRAEVARLTRITAGGGSVSVRLASFR